MEVEVLCPGMYRVNSVAPVSHYLMVNLQNGRQENLLAIVTDEPIHEIGTGGHGMKDSIFARIEGNNALFMPILAYSYQCLAFVPGHSSKIMSSQHW